jgi:cobalt-precorrin-5B (C1)-methyltransferase
LAKFADAAGGTSTLRDRIVAANTTAQAFVLAQAEGIALGDGVAREAQQTAARVVACRDIAIEIAVFNRDGELVGRAPF